MITVVLGVGFSGTTLVSELLHHSGVRMIDDERDEYDKGGKYEHPDFQNVNMNILELLDEQAFHLRVGDCPRVLTVQQKETIIELISRQNNRYPEWGFKDPRTVVTYPLWQKLLQQHRVIAIYRDPASNWPRHRWRGLRKRYSNPWRAYVHIRQWVEYNDAILTIGEKQGADFILLNYEKLMSSNEELDRVADFLGRPVDDRRKPGMHRSRSQGDMLFRGVRWLMNFTPYSPEKMLKRLEVTHAVQCHAFKKKTVTEHK